MIALSDEQLKLQALDFLVTDTNGRILRWGSSSPQSVDVQAQEDELVFLGTGETDTHYVNVITGEVLDRPTMVVSVSSTSIPANGVSEAVISGLPNTTTASVTGNEVTVTDGTLEFSVDLQGVYTIDLKSWPYKDTAVEVTAT